MIRLTPTASPGSSFRVARVSSPACGAAPVVGEELLVAKRRRDQVGDITAEPAEHYRRRDRPEHRADLCIDRAASVRRNRPARPPATPRTGGPPANADCSVAASVAGVIGRSSCARADTARGRRLGRLDHLVDRRDAGDRLASRSCRASTTRRRRGVRRCRPGCRSFRRSRRCCARGPPSSRARIRLRLGPITFRSTPMMSNLEIFDLVAFEDRPADAHHTGTDLADRHPGRGRGENREPKAHQGEAGDEGTESHAAEIQGRRTTRKL